MSRVQGKVAFVTGAARGQGRAHAIRLAEEGADLILADIAAPPTEIDYPPATPEDLAETVAAVEKLDRRVVHAVSDVRDLATLEKLVPESVREMGRVNI